MQNFVELVYTCLSYGAYFEVKINRSLRFETDLFISHVVSLNNP